jgi:hypothetical protein
LREPWLVSVRYHALHDGQALTRKAVLIGLADLSAWLAQKSWAGEPIYLIAEPLHGPLSKWRKSCAVELKSRGAARPTAGTNAAK